MTAPLKLKKLPKRKDPKKADVQSDEEKKVLTAYKLSKFSLEIAKNDVKDIWVRSSGFVWCSLFNMSACLSQIFHSFSSILSNLRSSLSFRN